MLECISHYRTTLRGDYREAYRSGILSLLVYYIALSALIFEALVHQGVVFEDLFFRAHRNQLGARHPEVIQLSHLLNQLPIHDTNLRQADFRNPEGVSMKLGNFLALDPAYVGTGLKRGGKLDREIWHEFAHDGARLRLTAAAIRKSASWIAGTSAAYDSRHDDDEFPEGKILTRLHQRKERNRRAADRKKKKVLQETNRLACEACGFDFAAIYGDLGSGFAECHHTVPVAELTEDHRTRLADLAILCANCHRMIHKSRPMLTVQALRAIIESHHTEAKTQQRMGWRLPYGQPARFQA